MVAASVAVILYLLARGTIGAAYRLSSSALLRAEVRYNKTRRVSVMSATHENGSKYRIRECAGGKDYSAVIGSVDAWWGGRRVSPMLPRLFFDNFCNTTFMAVRDEADEKELVVGFLCGFVSQSRAGEAHAHFIGIDPAHRGNGLGASLYDRFFQAVKARGVTVVHAVTSPVNTTSVVFHVALGFKILRVASSGGGGDDVAPVGGLAHLVQTEGASAVDREFVHVDYDGPDGGDRVLLEKRL